MKKILLMAMTGAAALALAACGSSGGGDGGSQAPVTDIPASALNSPAGLLDFANQQIAGGTNDTSEPFVVSEAPLPVDNTTETSL